MSPLLIESRTSFTKLAQQVLPFERDLSVCRIEQHGGAHGTDLTPVESISAIACLLGDRAQVRVDRDARPPAASEPEQLRMMPVSDRHPSQHGARQQPLSPQGHESLRIEVLRMQCPQSHRRYLIDPGVLDRLLSASRRQLTTEQNPSIACGLEPEPGVQRAGRRVCVSHFNLRRLATRDAAVSEQSRQQRMSCAATPELWLHIQVVDISAQATKFHAVPNSEHGVPDRRDSPAG